MPSYDIPSQKGARNHNESRRFVCGPCGKKITLSKDMRVLKEKQISQIKQFKNPDYDVNNPVYPIGICNTCRNKLNKAEKTGDSSVLPAMLNYEDILLPETTTSGTDDTGHTCNCFICLTARSHRKNKRILGDKIDNSIGLIGSSTNSSLPPKIKRK
eukprot:TRINITY_DN16607_c0_g1_i1.p1 TRINITY_DN16607_c0_g1~~TRINITY_DN16607_c0_g1_i1.p1  ORF type:complete len:157 (-),score=10.83 TRINITY_DN16607_c0_g1_i1:56-526(-)